MNDREAIKLEISNILWLRVFIRPVIKWLAKIGQYDIEFVPYGCAGDRLPEWFKCFLCKGLFYSSVSFFNETLVVCPQCKTYYRTRNDGVKAWIVGVK